MVDHLSGICQEEGIEADKDALHIIGQKADGALRDALSIFDRIVSFSGEKITYQDVITNLNVLDYDYYFKVIDAFMTEDVSTILTTFDDILRKGFEPDIFINGLAEHVRNLLVCKDKETLTLLEVSDNLKAKYEEQANTAPTSLLLTLLNLLNECDIHYRMARNKRLHVEMALIKMTYVNRAVNIAEGAPAAPEAVTAEKKKSEPRVEKTNTPTKQESSSPAPEPEEEEELESGAPLQKEEPKESAPVPSDKPKKKKHTMTRLDVGALMEEVKQDSEQSEQTKKEVTADELHKEWDVYIEENLPDSMKGYLKKAELKVEGLEIVALVGSDLARSTLQQESGLMDHLRDYFNQPKLSLKIKLDKSKAPKVKKPKRPMTSKEKLRQMNEKNPLIKEVWKRFDLRFDEE